MNEELRIKISAQIAEAQKNIKAIQEELEGVGSKGSSAAGKLKDAFSKMGKATGEALKVTAKAVTAATAAAAAGVVALTSAAIKNYAEYEQLVGGVETLFKDSANKVQQYAAEAYKTAGMSANEYMETVTGFSASLISSLEGDTAAAAEVANMAITDMSDNANKMGTSMEAIQNAYQGFAKQNYTMLDNLKLGYGGTKEEMQRLLEDAEKISGIEYDISNFADVAEAIHVVQTEMGITGTTAAEAASTINGSIGMMKASWQNLLTGIADENANFSQLVMNFVDSVGAVAENLLPRIEVALGGATQLIESLLLIAFSKIPDLINNLLPKVISAATGLVQSLVSVVSTVAPSLVNTIISAIPSLLAAIESAIGSILELLPTLLETVLSGLNELLPDLISGAVNLIVMLCESFGEIIAPILEWLPTLILTVVDALMTNLPALIGGLITLCLMIVEQLPAIIQGLCDALPMAIDLIIDSVIACLPQVLWGIGQLVLGIVMALPSICESLLVAIIEIATSIWDGICEVFSVVTEWFEGVFSDAFAAIEEAFSSVGEWASGVWDNITSALSSVGDWFGEIFSTAWQGICDAFSGVGDFFGGIWDSIKEIFSNVGATIGNAITNTVKTAINGVLSTACKIINGFISAINFAIDIINAIPGVSIGKLKTLSVPAMAKGGVVDSATLALIGERGKEMVMPLENNLEYLDKLAGMLVERMGGNAGGATKVYLQVDKKTLGEVVLDRFNEITKQTGYLPLLV